MLQLRQHRFQIAPHRLRWPSLAAHVLNQELRQLFQAGVDEGPVCIAPLAVVLVETAVRFSAEGILFQGHPTALTDQLPGRSQQGIDGHVKELREPFQRLRIRNRLPRITQLMSPQCDGK